MNFLTNTLVNNGGTTFLIRFCKEYVNSGQRAKVYVLFNKVDPNLLAELQRFAEVVFIYKKRSDIFSLYHLYFFFLNKKRLKKLLSECDQLHVMGIFGFLFSQLLLSLNPKLKITIGVYHQNEFMYSSRNKLYFHRFIFNRLKCIDTTNFCFFNELTRTNYEEYFNISFASSTILPIGIEIPNVITTDYQKHLIISVGNLVEFKTYNKHVINSLKDLIIEFPQIVYEIYGEGPDRINLENLVRIHGLQNHVFFKGKLLYNDFNRIVSRAHLFIGNGTAVIEAAACSVPSIVGIESYDEPLSYGMISQISGFDYNEFDIEKKKYYFSYLIASILRMDSEERQKIGLENRVSSEKFGITNTVLGFKKQAERIESFSFQGIKLYQIVLLNISFLILSFLEAFKINNEFSNRRNQGYKL